MSKDGQGNGGGRSPVKKGPELENALAGLKKQFFKASQYVKENIGAAEATQLDQSFKAMEDRTDVLVHLVDELQTKTKEFLQPNSTARAKMMSAARSTGETKSYLQPEDIIGDCMKIFGEKLADKGGNDHYSSALMQTGATFKMLAVERHSLDEYVKENFLNPLSTLQSGPIKDIMHHRKKAQSRRLDLDGKKRRHSKGGVSSEEVKQAEDKFKESVHLAQIGMYNLMDGETDRITQFYSLATGLQDYHRRCLEVLEGLTESLLQKQEAVALRPKSEFQVESYNDRCSDTLSSEYDYGQQDYYDQNYNRKSSTSLPGSSLQQYPNLGFDSTDGMYSQNKKPCCRALYDFQAGNSQEISFKEGEVIQLLSRVDENWLEGSLNGQRGYFPANYVEEIIPLPW